MSVWDFVEYESLAAKEKSSFSMGPFGSKITKNHYVNHGIPLIRGNNLSRGIFVDDGFVFITSEKADEIMSANVKPGDIIFTHRGTIGQVTMVPRSPKHDRYAIGSSQVKTRLDENLALPEFYYYWFRSPEGQRSILAHTSTVGVPGIATPLSTIRKLKVPRPPIKEQQNIAAALGALDDKIAVNERILITYEAMIQAQFDHIISTEQGEQEPEVLITELVEFNPKMGKPTEEDAVYVDMAALPTDRSLISTWGHRKPKSGSRFINGDTLMARITPCLENGKTGYVDFMRDGQVGMGSTEFIVMRSRPGIPREFSYFLARNKKFRSHAIQKMAGTSGRQRVSAADASEFFVRQPTEEEISAFGERASESFSHMKSLTVESRTLAELRDTLLPQLMSGKLRVKDAEKLVEDAT
ncbi:restriction endonuclease subunit S [Nocardiopsis algeriensis]|uniref:restriction endonuclease subunit S n=1 Tax=Nocardiopsis algeriensis TaxID=1478215 RepID=UPI003B43019A